MTPVCGVFNVFPLFVVVVVFFFNLFLCFFRFKQTVRLFFIVLIALGRQFYHRKLSEYTALGNHDRYQKKNVLSYLALKKKEKNGTFPNSISEVQISHQVRRES